MVLRPWRRAASVEDVDARELAAAGVRCVLLDRDNTLVELGDHLASPGVVAWVGSLRAAGMDVCVVSNNVLSRSLARTGEQLGCAVVAPAMKPAPFALWAALGRMGHGRDESVLVGDQLFTDVLAGSLAGMRTILVSPRSEQNMWYARPFRAIERRLLDEAPGAGRRP